MALIKNIEQLPTELLCGIFSRVDDWKSIQQSRLVSHRFHDAASPFLIRKATISMRSKSLERLEILSSHPIFSKSISSVTIVLSFFEAHMAADKALYMRRCEADLYPRLEILERMRWTRNKTKSKRLEPAEQKEREEIVSRFWKAIYSHEITNILEDGFDEASATLVQKLVLRLYAMYKERSDDQEQVRQGNKHIDRICTALGKLPGLIEIKIIDLPHLVLEKLKVSDFEDLGFTRNYLEPFDFAISTSQFYGTTTTAASVNPPFEMIGELACQLGHSGIRPKTISIDFYAPANLRPMALTPSQQAGVRELVSKASNLSIKIADWHRKGTLYANNSRPRDEMLALCSFTQPYFTAPNLESLHLNLYGYPHFYEVAPTVSLHDLLPLQKPWHWLQHLEMNCLPAHLEELMALVAMQKDTVTSFDWISSWLLSGRWEQAVETLRGFNKLKRISLENARGERFQLGARRDVPYEIHSYILREIDTNPLLEVEPPQVDST